MTAEARSWHEATPESMNQAAIAAATAMLDGPCELVGTEVDGESSALAWIVVDGERLCTTSGRETPVRSTWPPSVAVGLARLGAPAGNTKPILHAFAENHARFASKPAEHCSQ